MCQRELENNLKKRFNKRRKVMSKSVMYKLNLMNTLIDGDGKVVFEANSVKIRDFVHYCISKLNEDFKVNFFDRSFTDIIKEMSNLYNGGIPDTIRNRLSDFVAYTVKNSWYGAENLSLIPGEVGASAVQNIGAYGVEAKDLIVSVETVEVETGRKRIFTKEECRYAYRESIFKKDLKGKYIVTYVTYRLSKQPVFNLEYGNVRGELEKRGGEVALENVRKVIIAVREAKLPDPRVQGNAGSFFMNPIVPRRQFEIVQQQYPDMPHYEVDGNRVKIPAAWMIDRCGWKGKQIGRAGVHSKQALVLVNCGGATGDEVIALARRIQESVLQKFGVAISPEVNFI